MITVCRWFMVGMLLSLYAGCAEYEALPHDYQPQQQPQATAAVIAALRAQRDRIMKIVFESSTAIVTYLDTGDRPSGALYRTRGTWENFESAERAYRFLPSSAWEPISRQE
jgi:hypothetical protein